MSALQNEINVASDVTVCFPAVNLRPPSRTRPRRSSMEIVHVTRARRSVAVSEIYGRRCFVFGLGVTSRRPIRHAADSVYGAAGSGAAACDAGRFNYVGQ